MHKFKLLKSIELPEPNENFKTVITLETHESRQDFYILTVSDHERSERGKKLWSQRGHWAIATFDKETLKEFGKFLLDV